ncbi:type IV conjugative transfer system protein TraL [Klebsiella pneumoniae]|uniref:type IV conjugative transfer system protein TraL n=1 Tax=Klebsiella pneumoniae TaxID=573 RepID=UPI002362E7DE|nr:type IV conjugative transfer system protein TraL [Klebsiella pneumoniae]MDD1214986.1 type IV conjugative transfer system protein TraL [Klebsiella pneumoniae]
MENNYTYRFPYRINLPLLILFFDAKQIGVVMGLLAFGNIFECMTIATVTAVVYWVSYNKAKESSVRGRLKHKLWWNGFLPGRTVYQSRYLSDPFMRVLYS